MNDLMYWALAGAIGLYFGFTIGKNVSNKKTGKAIFDHLIKVLTKNILMYKSKTSIKGYDFALENRIEIIGHINNCLFLICVYTEFNESSEAWKQAEEIAEEFREYLGDELKKVFIFNFEYIEKAYARQLGQYGTAAEGLF